MVKVVKFGGSSLANAGQLKKVFDILKEDKERKYVVVSAPGKRDDDDTKVTDMLIAYHRAYLNGADTAKIEEQIITRFTDMLIELDMDVETFEPIINDNVTALSTIQVEGNEFLLDAFLSSGENINAQIIAEYLTQYGLKARYLHPHEVGIIVTPEPHNARMIDKYYKQIAEINDGYDGITVIPGFFGVTEEGQTCAFSRGGSDISGSIVAAGVGAELYENFTDVDGIFAAHPGIVHEPMIVEEVTYREMRELAYAGFTILHDEALMPTYRAKIPVVIKNTNNPSAPGSRIISSHSADGGKHSVVGIAGDSGFSSISISKYLMNREIGFTRRVLQILEDYSINFHHMPTGIDDISILVRTRDLTEDLEEQIKFRIKNELDADDVFILNDLSTIAVVGDGVYNQKGLLSKATTALAHADVNISMITQGTKENSIMFGIKTPDLNSAIRALYTAFFEMV
ncbi:MAG: aspartate kinase [Lactobacillales bacterium]|jgi:aspartate kinase|nr:aspartate kinase [Lactobacillales bacterium]